MIQEPRFTFQWRKCGPKTNDFHKMFYNFFFKYASQRTGGVLSIRFWEFKNWMYIKPEIIVDAWRQNQIIVWMPLSVDYFQLLLIPLCYGVLTLDFIRNSFFFDGCKSLYIISIFALIWNNSLFWYISLYFLLHWSMCIGGMSTWLMRLYYWTSFLVFLSC